MEVKINKLTPDGFLLSEISRLSNQGISIAVDFDSTLCLTDGYPHIVGQNGKCFDILHEWQKLGCKILLYTMRHGEDLDNAVAWCRECGFEFDGINCNPENDARDPECDKLYAVFYIDDKAFGTPLLRDTDGNLRDHVDWEEIDRIFTPLIHEIKNKLVNNKWLEKDLYL